MTRIVSFVVLLAIIIVVGIVSFEVLSSFVLPLFIALLLVIMFRPLHELLLRRLGGRVRLAAALTTITILLMVLIPMLWILARAATETVSLVSELKQDDLAGRFANVRRRLGLDGPPEELQKKFAEIETTLGRVRESLILAASSTDKGEVTLRREWIKDLGRWSLQLDADLDALAAARGPESETASSNQDTALRQSLVALQTNIRALEAAQSDRAAALEAVVRADTALKSLKSLIFGSPVIVWLKDQLNLNKNQFDDFLIKVRETAGPLALGTTQFISSFLLDFVVGFVVMIVGLYYFLADGPEMISALMRLSPLDDKYEAQLLTQFSELTRAVILAMLLAAVAQGLLAGIGYILVDFGNVFMLTVVTTVFAMVPFIGATAVWGGCCLWLALHDGRPQAAIGLAIYGTVVVSLADNLIKPMVLHGRSNLHPLLALLSVLGGAKALGPIGIVLGPIVVAFLQTLLVMLRSELLAMDASKIDGQGGAAVTSIGLDQGAREPATLAVTTPPGGEKGSQ